MLLTIQTWLQASDPPSNQICLQTATPAICTDWMQALAHLIRSNQEICISNSCTQAFLCVACFNLQLIQSTTEQLMIQGKLELWVT